MNGLDDRERLDVAVLARMVIGPVYFRGLLVVPCASGRVWLAAGRLVEEVRGSDTLDGSKPQTHVAVIARRQHAPARALKAVDGIALGWGQRRTAIDCEEPQLVVLLPAQTTDRGVITCAIGLSIARRDVGPTGELRRKQGKSADVPIVGGEGNTALQEDPISLHARRSRRAAAPFGNIPSAAASTLSASRRSTIFPSAAVQWPKNR